MSDQKGLSVHKSLISKTLDRQPQSKAQRVKHLLPLVVLGIVVGVSILVGCSAQANSSTSASGEGSYALIYNGPVAAEDGPGALAAIVERLGLSIKFVSDIAELPALLNDAAIVIIGGTQDNLNPLVAAFTPEVTAALKAYLQNGGHYFGICGGAFLASTGWEEGDNFVKMLGIIPAESGDLDDNDGPRILPINWLGKTYQMYFQAGPTFEIESGAKDVRVMAHYANGEVAALMSSYGQGMVAVSGPHPEARESWADEAEDGDNWTSTADLVVDLLHELLD
jgi:hypothetical protein